ncbi:MAG TPA: MoaD/ThiS family protein [Planctomycetaceae bacterium]|nr:MoaD/ThiS family protein [Planctomycetaceae bacterium]
MPSIFIPPTLRTLTGGVEVVAVEGTTVREALRHLEQLHPGFESRFCDGGKLRPGMTLAVNNRFAADGLRTAVGPHDEIHVLPAIGGG